MTKVDLPNRKFILTVPEVAAYYRVCTGVIYRLSQAGLLPGAKIGHQWRFNRAAIERITLGPERFQGIPLPRWGMAS